MDFKVLTSSFESKESSLSKTVELFLLLKESPMSLENFGCLKNHPIFIFNLHKDQMMANEL